LTALWSEDVAALIGRHDYVAEGYSQRVLSLFIWDMASPRKKEQLQAEGVGPGGV
jgi:hypothetical protein